MAQKKPIPADAPQEQQGQGNAGGRTPPVHEVRVGRIRGIVWANRDKERGTWYSVNITRSYKDGQNVWKQATSYGVLDLLVVAEVARLCWLFIAQQNGSKFDGSGHAGEQGPSDEVPI